MRRVLIALAACGFWPAAAAADVGVGPDPASSLFCADLECASAYAADVQVWPESTIPPPVIVWNGPVDFNGTTDLIDLGTPDVLGSAISLVTRFTADTFANADHRMISKADGVQDADHLWMLSERVDQARCRINAGGSTATVIGGTLTVGVDHHVACTYDGSFVVLYVDGVQVASVAKTGSLGTDATMSAFVGAQPPAPGDHFFDGTIDHAHVYDFALTAAEVEALATDVEPPPPAVTASLTADPLVIEPGGSSTLAWTSENADSCDGTNFSTGGATSGSLLAEAIAATTTYELDCTRVSPSDSAHDEITVVVSDPGTATIAAVQDGDWDDPATWDQARVPGQGDTVLIQGFTVERDQNVIVDGPGGNLSGGVDHLIMRPPTAALRFVNVNETAFTQTGGLFGCGTQPPSTDVGLWVLCDGTLDLEGTPKTPWARLAGAANAGAPEITLENAPAGWLPGDRIVVVPTEHPNVGSRSWNGFEERQIAASYTGGATIPLDAPLSHDHPTATDPFTGAVHTAEVLILSRDVRIEGTGNSTSDPDTNGRAHILIQASAPQSISHVEIRHMGPRRHDPNQNTEGVAGRYPLHFHHSGDGSRGSFVDGVVVRTVGNHAFVPHASHGITFRQTVAYDVWEDAYWWDPGDPEQTHDVFYDRTVAALLKDDPAFRGLELTGFQLERGANTRINGAVAVGVQGNVNASGYHWPSTANGAQFNVWDFAGNLAHNNKNHGLFVWQNDSNHHIITDLTVYRVSNAGIDHGAYLNCYTYDDVRLFENGNAGLELHALPRNLCQNRPDGYFEVFENFHSTDRLHVPKHNLPSDLPVLLRECSFSSVRIDEDRNPGLYDFVNCVDTDDGTPLAPADFQLVTALTGMRVRVQDPDCTAWQMDHNGTVTAISPFYSCDPP